MSFLFKPKPEKFFHVSAAPFFHVKNSTRRVFWTRSLVLIPIWAGAIFAFGNAALQIFLTAVSSALLWEFLFSVFAKQKIRLDDGSTFFYASLFGLFLPPTMPVDLIVIGTFVLVVLAKEIFGGVGNAVFNPSQTATAFLLVLFPSEMIRVTSTVSGPGFFNLVFGTVYVRMLGEVSGILILVGAVFLFRKQWARTQIPILFFAAALMVSAVFDQPISQPFSPCMWLAGVFLLTDDATTPITLQGRRIAAVLAGFLSILFGMKLPLSQSVTFAVLLTNAAVPVLDALAQPKKSFLGLW